MGFFLMQLSLSQRVARCVHHATVDGEATILVVARGELETARAMVGDRPVIVCAAGQQVREFLRHYEMKLAEEYQPKRRTKR